MEASSLSLRAREILVPLCVALGVALIQAVFSGPDLVRFLVYFVVGLTLGVSVVQIYRYARTRAARAPAADMVRAAALVRRSSEASPPTTTNPRKERTWSSVKAEDLIAIEKMSDLTRNERNRLLAPYAGQWLFAEGLVNDVNGTADDYLVAVSIRERGHYVEARFTDDKERASSLRKGIAVRIAGQISNVTNYGIELLDCEFGETVGRSPAPVEGHTGKDLREMEPAQVATAPRSSPDVRTPAQHGTAFSGVGVGDTPKFRVSGEFGFGWTPNKGIVIGALHGTVNGLPMSWTFDNNLNPYFPAKFAPAPDVPGDYYFTIDNIAPGAAWTITVLYE